MSSFEEPWHASMHLQNVIFNQYEWNYNLFIFLKEKYNKYNHFPRGSSPNGCEKNCYPPIHVQIPICDMLLLASQ